MTAKEEAIERLAEALQFKMEHLDPGEGDWSELDDRSREFYRQLVEWLLLHEELLLTAMQQEAAE